MPRFLPTLDTKALKAAAASPKRALASYSFGWQFPYIQRWNVERTVRDAFERNIWVWRCVDRIATDFASLPIVLREGNPETGEIVENPPRQDSRLLHLLNKRPNPHQSARDFKYLIGCLFLLSRAGVFVELIRDRAGNVAAMYVMPPDKVAPIPDEEKYVAGYRVTYATGSWDDLPPEDVVWIRKPHPTDPYSGTIPTEAAGINIDSDFYMNLFARNFAVNDGRPSALIGVKGQLLESDAQELKSRFRGGTERSGEVSVIEADQVDYVDLATTPREAQFVESRKHSREDILLAFGVPESVLGNASGRTYDNADAEEEVYWRATVKPDGSFILESFDRLTSGGVEDDLYLVPDYSGVYVLQRDERERAARLQTEFDKGLISVDEYRDGTGREPFDVPESRVLWVAAQGKIPVALNDADEQEAVELLQSVNPKEAEEGETAVPPKRGDDRALRAVKELPFGATHRGLEPGRTLYETKRRIWREEQHPRDPYTGRFIEKGDLFARLLELDAPGFNPLRVERSRETDAPGLSEVRNAVGDRTVDELLEGDDAAAMRAFMRRTAIALDTNKWVESGEGDHPDVVELERLKRVALTNLGAELGFEPAETDEAIDRLESMLGAWAFRGDLGPSRIRMHDATMHLRAGGRVDDLDTRALALQKAYTEATWNAKYGPDETVPIVRFVRGEYADRISAVREAYGDDWEIDAWPLSSWSVERVSDSLVSRWIGRNRKSAELKMDVTRDETWLTFWGEGKFRSRSLRAPGEFVVDDRRELSPRRGLGVELYNYGDRERMREAYRVLAEHGIHPDEASAAFDLMRDGTSSDLIGFPDDLLHPQVWTDPSGWRRVDRSDPEAEKQALQLDDVIPNVQMVEESETLYGGANDRDLIREVLETDPDDDAALEAIAERSDRLVGRHQLSKLARMDPDRSTVSDARRTGENAVTVREWLDGAEVEATGERGWLHVQIERPIDAEGIERVRRAADWARERGLSRDELEVLRTETSGQGDYESKGAFAEAGYVRLKTGRLEKLEPGTRYLTTSDGRYVAYLEEREEYTAEGYAEKRDRGRRRIQALLAALGAERSREEIGRFYLEDLEYATEPPEDRVARPGGVIDWVSTEWAHRDDLDDLEWRQA